MAAPSHRSRRLMALALLATSSKVWATCPTDVGYSLPPQTSTSRPAATWGASRRSRSCGLRVELALAISGHPQGLNAARRGRQVAAVGAVAIALAEASCSLPSQLRSPRLTLRASPLPTRCAWPHEPVRVSTAGPSADQAELESSAPGAPSGGGGVVCFLR